MAERLVRPVWARNATTAAAAMGRRRDRRPAAAEPRRAPRPCRPVRRRLPAGTPPPARRAPRSSASSWSPAPAAIGEQPTVPGRVEVATRPPPPSWSSSTCVPSRAPGKLELGEVTASRSPRAGHRPPRVALLGDTASSPAGHLLSCGGHRPPRVALLGDVADVADVQRGELGDHRQGDRSSRGAGDVLADHQVRRGILRVRGPDLELSGLSHRSRSRNRM